MRKISIKNISIFILTLTTLVFGYFTFRPKDVKTITVPIRIEVPIQSKIGTFPPIKLPKPKHLKDKSNKYVENIVNQDVDSLKSIIKDLVAEKQYEQKFKDSVQEITVNTVIEENKIKQQSLSYHIFADTVSIDTKVTVPIPVKSTMILGITTGTPLESQKLPIIIDGTYIGKNKKIGTKISYDINNKQVLGGIAIKF